MKSVSHEIDLDPASQVRDALPEEARRRSAIMEKVRHAYLRTQRDAVVKKHFERLMEDLLERRNPAQPEDISDPEARAARLEGNMMVVLGESGAGKSAAIRRLLTQHPLCPNYGEGGARCRVLTVRVPSPCSVGELGRKVLRATGYKLGRTKASSPEIWGIVHERLRALGILVLHLDEFQDAHLTLSLDEQTKLRHLLRTLLVDEQYPVGLIISGQPEFEAFIRPDRSSVRRGSWQVFEKIDLARDGEAVGSAVRALASIAELRVDEDAVRVIVPRLVHAGCNLLGIVIEEIHDAIRTALERPNPTHLNLEHFADAYAMRTGSFALWNPYAARDFLAVDPTRVLARSEPDAPKPKRVPRKRRLGGQA